MKGKLVVLLLLLGLAAPVLAQDGETEQTQEMKDSPWRGGLTIGANLSRGNSFSDSVNVDFNMTKKTKQNRITFNTYYLFGRTKEGGETKPTDGTFFASVKYDYFISEKLYAFTNGNYKTDHVADLDYRLIGGAGLGYQWVESEKMNFNTDAGIAHTCEQYTTFDNDLGDLVETKNDDTSLQLGYHFDWVINENMTFIHNVNYYPSALSTFFLTADAELRVKLTESWYASAKAIMDYDSEPAEDLSEVDHKYILGVGWSF